MRKSLINLLSVVGFISLILLSCEEAPLDKSAAPIGDLSEIKVVTTRTQTGNPDDDSGLPPGHSTGVNEEVKFSSERVGVVKRVWRFPEDANIMTPNLNVVESDLGGERVKLVEELGEISVSFIEPNDTGSQVEGAGFVISVTETLSDGSIKRSTTQIQVRNEVKAAVLVRDDALPFDVDKVIVTTISSSLKIKSVNAATLGLSASDIGGPGQLTLDWDFGNGFIILDGEPVNKFSTNNVDREYEVFYANTTDPGNDDEIKFKVRRAYPIESESSLSVKVRVFDQIVIADSIELSTAGDEITLTYPEAITGVSDLTAEDYSLNYSYVSGLTNEEQVVEVSIADIVSDSSNANVIVLNLADKIDPIISESISLSFASNDLTSEAGGLPVIPFDEAGVAEPENFITSGFVYYFESEEIGATASLTNQGIIGDQPLDPNSTLTISNEGLNEFSPSTHLLKLDQVDNVDHTTFYFVDLGGLENGKYVMSYSARATEDVEVKFFDAGFAEISNPVLSNEWETYSTTVQTVNNEIMRVAIQFAKSEGVGAYQLFLDDFKVLRVE